MIGSGVERGLSPYQKGGISIEGVGAIFIISKYIP
jgi:hypothetical protein